MLDRSRAALAHPNFRKVFFARALSGVGDAMIPVAVTFAVLDVGTFTELGWVLACQWGARLLFLVVGGVWADRLPRRDVMIAADAIRAAVQGAIALSAVAGALTVWQLAAASAVSAAASTFFNPASTGLVLALVTSGDLREANALMGIARGGFEIVGPAVAGFVVVAVGFDAVFALDAATFIGSLLLLSAIDLREVVTPPQESSFIDEAREGIREVAKRRWMVAALACDVIFNFGLAAYFVLGPVVAQRSFDGARTWGWLVAVGAVGSLIGGAASLRYKPSRPFLIAYVLALIMPLELAALAVPLSLLSLSVGAAGASFAIVVMNTYWVTLEQQYVPPNLISRVDSVTWSASLVAMPAGLMIVGPVASAVGVRVTLVGTSLLVTLGVIGALSVADVRNVRWVGGGQSGPFDSGVRREDATDVGPQSP